MYIIIGILIVICFLLLAVFFFRKGRIIRKVRCMDFGDKLELLNSLAEPFGFCYCPAQDIMTSRVDAFQKSFGYCSLYDKSALKFGMVFDCEPVYFEYGNRTWMIELWKGQYGINVGAEIGVYYADRIIPPEQYGKEIFHGVEEEDMLPLSMKLNYKGQPLFSRKELHWWLTGFRTGEYTEPEDVSLEVSIVFPNEEMKKCFLESLCRMGYHQCEISVCCYTVSYSFSVPHARQPRLACRAAAALSQWQNRFVLGLYLFVTRPFACTMDKILYLYFCLPAAFCRMLRLKKNRKQKCPRKYKKKIRKTRRRVRL